ncbi:hypothetical protein HK102_008767 [Quaeritorhiza haematococci]|nr:hypothetical protein HK102_008767 [Quaeritorhiza haematococci]
MAATPPPTIVHKNWEIDSLGTPQFNSPLDSVCWVEDDQVVLLDPSMVVTPTSASSPERASPTLHTPSLEKAGPRKKIFFHPSYTVAGIVTCGGLCPGLNDVVRAIVNCLTYRYGIKNILGFKYGYAGLNPETSQVMQLTPHVVRDIHQFGGTILGSSRGPQPPTLMVDQLVHHNVDVLFTIGGDGTQKGAQAIVKEVQRRGLKIAVVGIPKTIDNDICYIERTFGFETAVQLAEPAIKAAHEEARSALNGIGIVKLMGRESGFIALHASLASGEVNLLLLPEMKFTMEAVVEFVVARLKASQHCVIVVSEGAGQELCASNEPQSKDASGNVKFMDIGVWLNKELGKRLNARQIPHTIKYIDPSYTIRSARCSASDAAFALQLGFMAAHAAMAGKTNVVVGMVNNRFVHIPIERAVEYRKKVDVRGLTYQSFLDSSGQPAAMIDGDAVREHTERVIGFKKAFSDAGGDEGDAMDVAPPHVNGFGVNGTTNGVNVH